MKSVLDLGQMLTAHARLSPQRIGARDLERSMTFDQWNSRACRLANALLGLGLSKGDRVAILAYNTVEWVEIYAAAAKAGIVAVPLNFRLVGKEIRYIVDDAEADCHHRSGPACRSFGGSWSRAFGAVFAPYLVWDRSMPRRVRLLREADGRRTRQRA